MSTSSRSRKTESRMAKAIKLALMEQEHPSSDIALQRAEQSLRRNRTSSSSSSSAAACDCPHLREYLPHQLEMDLVLQSNGQHWVLKNPVHALHLQSQMEGGQRTTISAADHSNSNTKSSDSITKASSNPRASPSNSHKDTTVGSNTTSAAPPILYGEEQERRQVLQTRGFSHLWHPYTDDWTNIHHKEGLARKKLAVEARQKAERAAVVAAADRKMQSVKIHPAPKSSTSSSSNHSSKKKQKTASSSTTTTASKKPTPLAAPTSSSSLQHPKATTSAKAQAVVTAPPSSGVPVAPTSAAAAAPPPLSATDEDSKKTTKKTKEEETLNVMPTAAAGPLTKAAAAAATPTGNATTSPAGTTTTTDQPSRVQSGPSSSATAVAVQPTGSTSAEQHPKQQQQPTPKKEDPSPTPMQVENTVPLPQPPPLAAAAAAPNSSLGSSAVAPTQDKPTLQVQEEQGKAPEKASSLAAPATEATALPQQHPSASNPPASMVASSTATATATTSSSAVLPRPDGTVSSSGGAATAAAATAVPTAGAAPPLPPTTTSAASATATTTTTSSKNNKPTASGANKTAIPDTTTSTTKTSTALTIAATTIKSSAEPEPEEPAEPDERLLGEARFWSLQSQETHVKQLQKTFLSKRPPLKKMSSTGSGTGGAGHKKRKTSDSSSKGGGGASGSGGSGGSVAKSSTSSLLTQMSAWKEHALPAYQMTAAEEREWQRQGQAAERQVQRWMQNYRQCRESYWREKQVQNQPPHPASFVFGALEPEPEPPTCTVVADDDDEYNDNNNNKKNDTDNNNSKTVLPLVCGLCNNNKSTTSRNLSFWDDNTSTACDSLLRGDDLMHCLECSFVGCGPRSVASGKAASSTKEHILQHFLLSNHSFAVTCGPQGSVYCFKCADFVYHDIFDQEKERIDLKRKLPRMAWKQIPVLRSFDAFQYLHVPDMGVFWNGMHGAYLTPISAAHLRAARASRWRQMVFHGEVDELPLSTTPRGVVRYAASQGRLALRRRSAIPAPVGMYNLGNTCFQSAVLQCLIACGPIQKFFLNDVMHHHVSCAQYRESASPTKDPPKRSNSSSSQKGDPRKKLPPSCLACELDKLMLRYIGSAQGVNVFSAMDRNCQADESLQIRKGEPLVTAEILTTAWKCGDMDHLAGYDQRDAHEFCFSFLDNIGKHDLEYQSRIANAVNFSTSSSTISNDSKKAHCDIATSLFEGTFRSVLVCQQCGNKRVQQETFRSIPLDLSKEVQMAAADAAGKSHGEKTKLAVDLCLQHFTMPETLGDQVDCQSCGKKTVTKKQQVISKLPRILCLHLKRFDAAHNRKVEDFVAFPPSLNMGSYLPHWCEVPRVPSSLTGAGRQPPSESEEGAGYVPDITYSLFGTVNHYGSMQSGHYTANIKMNDMWYHCNDQHVSRAGVGNGVAEVLAADGAYLLFYSRSH